MQLIVGLEGLTLSKQDRARIVHPEIAGVILFARNYDSPDQLRALTADIRKQRADLLISVDHEGGRVQRFREGFTRLPAARLLVQRFRLNPSEALAIAESCGLVMGIELQQRGIDLNYAPVLDMDFGLSEVIGDRSFGHLTQEVVALAGAVMRGMHGAGMAAIGKHFPGHGGVMVDTHGDVAIDARSLDYLWQADLIPFQRLIAQGLDGIMPAHVIYSQIDSVPAGFSKIWLQEILRKQMNFQGTIISDDLDMLGANAVGDLAMKLEAATLAGCDLALLCNHFDSIDRALSLKKSFFKPVNVKKLFGRYIQSMPKHFVELLPTLRARLAQI